VTTKKNGAGTFSPAPFTFARFRTRVAGDEGSAGDQNAPQVSMPFRFAQLRPVLQVRLATTPVPQQGWPMAPHAAQRAAPPTPAQTKPVEQKSAAAPTPGQQI